MTITIYEGYDKTYVLIGSKDERFIRKYGKNVRIPVFGIHGQLSMVASWVNNDLGEECLFEVE